MKIIYSSHPEQNNIKVWRLNIQKKLELIQTFNIDGVVQPLLVNFVNKVIYAGIKYQKKITTLKIQSKGNLTKLSEIKIPGDPSYIAVDKFCRYFFVASYNHSLFTISNIKNDGTINTPHQVVNNIKGCHSVNIDCKNKTIFIPALLEDCIYIYKLSKNGCIDVNSKNKILNNKKSGPRHMVFHPNKKNFYNINELNSTIDSWEINDNIKRIQIINILPDNYIEKKWASDIHIHPNGKYLYACDRSANIITIMKINKQGNLKVIDHHKTEQQSREFIINTNGNYLVIAGQKHHFITIYKINLDGKLTMISRNKAEKNPTWIAIY